MRYPTNLRDTYVIKAGTDALSKNGKPDERVMRRLVYQVARLREEARIILVSSGAIGTGCSLLPDDVGKAMGKKKQALSGLGQNMLMGLWTKYFAAHGIHCAQGLVEDHDFETERGRKNIRRSFHQYHQIEDCWGEPIVPIINGNDFVSIDPIKNDNDRNAANIAIIVRAKHLVLLTDVDGLFTGHPDDPRSSLIPEVHAGHDRWKRHIRKKKSKNGTGGFRSKGMAAEDAALEGVLAHIGSSRTHNAIRRLMDGQCGTTFYR